VDLGPETWLAVLVEEVGEVARDVLERRHDHLDQELAQVAAVAIRWMEARR
jgi:NTP pyrophosphatase (non-canonical NTP hydrolase)